MNKQEFLKSIEAGNPPAHLNQVEKMAHLRLNLAYQEMASNIFEDVPEGPGQKTALDFLLESRGAAILAIVGEAKGEDVGSGAKTNGKKDAPKAAKRTGGAKKPAAKKRAGKAGPVAEEL